MVIGLYGFYVLIGIIFLLVCFFRYLSFYFICLYYIGFECVIWYWYFVDVVWIFLFIFIYWWGLGELVD